MSQIRVLQIISGFAVEGPLGGVERFGIELAQAFDRDRVEPIVCGMWDYNTLYERHWMEKLRSTGVQAFIPAQWEEKSPYRSFWQAFQGTRRVMSGQEVDIIHSHCQFGDVLALMLKRSLGTKVIVRTVHNEREWGKRPLRRLLLTGLLYPLCYDAELGVAQQVVDNLNHRFTARLLRRQARKAYNAINVQRFENVAVDRMAKRSSLGIPEEVRVVGTVGRLTAQKGYHVLLEAAVSVLSHLPQTYFLIIGSGELEEELKQRAHQLGINKRVLFTGPRDDVEELLQIMDLFVNSSLWEGLPTVILESMVADVPVVATTVAGNQELIRDGVTGCLVPPANPQELSQAIVGLLTERPEIIEKMCRQAHLHARANFSITRIVAQHEALYEKLCR
jgi:glycosyltransferase involved in cell wall biosynthesis